MICTRRVLLCTNYAYLRALVRRNNFSSSAHVAHTNYIIELKATFRLNIYCC